MKDFHFVKLRRTKAVNFYFVQLRGIKKNDGGYEYQSLIQRQQGSLAMTKTFDNADEMLTIHERFSNLFKPIQAGSHQFSNLELTDQQAEALGWKFTQ